MLELTQSASRLDLVKGDKTTVSLVFTVQLHVMQCTVLPRDSVCLSVKTCGL